MLKIQDSSGEVIGILKDDESAPEMKKPKSKKNKKSKVEEPEVQTEEEEEGE